MRLSSSSVLLLDLAATAIAYPSRRSNVQPPQADHEKARAVKEAFEISWSGYYKYAFPHDTLHPVSNTFEDDRCVLGSPRSCEDRCQANCKIVEPDGE
jgi:mannosyl-oligosaccharide alpha-1,2-mannosidase